VQSGEGTSYAQVTLDNDQGTSFSYEEADNASYSGSNVPLK
jgi:hypothetical protein